VSTVAFQYHGDDISRYFDIPTLHRYLNIFLVLAYLLPPLMFYCGMYLLNVMFVRLLAKRELDEKRHVILRQLITAVLSKQAVNADPVDLVGEMAWTSLRKCWRPK